MSGERLLEQYPLTWPLSQKRTVAHQRVEGAFKTSLFEASQHLRKELHLLGTRDVVVSSNLQLRRDGLPYADAREPDDPGVAVYFDRRIGHTSDYRPFVIACDKFRKVRNNIRAVGLTIEALRSISRHGASSMMEQAFTGFAALPPATSSSPWWAVLGVSRDTNLDDVRDVYRQLVKQHHPDHGGDPERFAAITAAYKIACAGAPG